MPQQPQPQYKSQARGGGAGPQGPREKILRIGIILGGKIVEERLIRKRQNVTIGQSAKNTFAIPAPELPRSFSLFVLQGGKYYLHVSDAMDGRLSDGGQVQTLAQVKQSGKAQRHGSGWLVPLSDSARGKVMLADMTLLFQFVMAPPLQPRPQLPQSVRGRLADRIDPWLAVILALSFMVHGGVGAFIYRMDLPRKPEPDEIPVDFIVSKRVTVKKAEPKPVAVAEPTAGPAAPDPGTPADPGPVGPRKKDKPAGPGKSQEDIQAEIEAARQAKKQQAAAIIRTVATTGSGGGRHAGSSNAKVAGDIDKKIEGTVQAGGQVAVGGAGGGSKRPGGSAVGTGTGGSRVTGGGGREDGGATAVTGDKPKLPKATPRKPISVPGSGELDPEHVYGKINGQYAGGVRKCYEDALKANSSLAGAVKVTFTVGGDGGVVSVDVKGFDDSVDKCISNKARGWKFNAPKKGTPTFQITFDLAPAS